MEYSGVNAGFDFNALDFSNIDLGTTTFMKSAEGNTDADFFFGDEGIDTTGPSFNQQSFDSLNASSFPVSSAESSFAMPQNLVRAAPISHQESYCGSQGADQPQSMDNTLGGALAWDGQLSADFVAASAQSFDALCQPQLNNNKRSLQLDTQDFPQSKRHESADYASNFASPFVPSASMTGSSWTAETLPTPSSSVEVGLSDEAADVCATWYSRYGGLPTDRHIDSLSQLTGESAPAIRHWFGQMLKQGMAGHDSAYKSQTSFSQQDQSSEPTTHNQICDHETLSAQPALRGGKKGCTPTSDPEKLRRDPTKIFQCTRKCGKRYGRKCDWKRNEEEGYPSKSWMCSLCISQGVEKVKPCFRKYHFSQHFRNIHPGLNSAEYEEASTVQSNTNFPRKCGFCPHRFTSRQDRIDHIAEHFKKGKCMLDWNDDEDESRDDNADDDDDDDTPDSGGFQDNSGGPSDQRDDQRDSRAKRKNNDDNNGGDQGSFGSFGRFQLSSLSDSGLAEQSSCAEQRIQPIVEQETDKRELISAPTPDVPYCVPSEPPRSDETARDHSCTLARNGVSEPLKQDVPQCEAATPSPVERVDATETREPRHQDSSLGSILRCLIDAVETSAGRRSLPANTQLQVHGLAKDIRGSSSTVKGGPSSDRCTFSSPKPPLPPPLLDEILHHAPKIGNDGPSSDTLRDAEAVRKHQRMHEQEKQKRSVATTRGSDHEHPHTPDLHRNVSRSDELARHSRVYSNLKAGTNGHRYPISSYPGGLVAEHGLFSIEDMLRTVVTAIQLSSVLHEATVTPELVKNEHVETLGIDVFKRILITPHMPFAKANSIHGQDIQQSLNLLKEMIRLEVALDKYVQTRPPNANGPPEILTMLQSVGKLQAFRDASSAYAKLYSSLQDELCEVARGLSSAHTSSDSQSDKLQQGLAQAMGISDCLVRSVASATKYWRELNSPLSGQPSHEFVSVKLLGTGGFSTVDEVVHQDTKLRISRKTLKNKDHSALEELRNEVQVLQKLRHPHIIRFLGAYSKGDKVSILLSPVAETTLAIWLDGCVAHKPEGLNEMIIKMLGCLASSIRYLHEQRPVVKHMDIKPQNILVVQGEHDMPHVVLSDFGVSSFEETLEEQDSKPLTRRYCAPEVPSGNARDRPADIWSLGCVFLEMLNVAIGQDSAQWQQFHKEFSGRDGKHYWQEVPRIQLWLSCFLEETGRKTEVIALQTVKSMLNSEPAERPDATTLTMIFTPAPCCLSWPNENASFPGPQEELRSFQEASSTFAKLHSVPNDELESAEFIATEDAHAELKGGRESPHQHEPSPFSCVKAWVQDCSEQHEACRPQSSAPRTLPTRLVDIGPDHAYGKSVRVINSSDLKSSSDDIHYVAISHVWGASDVKLCSDNIGMLQKQLPRELLSRSIIQAIDAAKRAGYRYIWVDSLCVVQDLAEDKYKECTTMASVYRNAALTIVVGNQSMPDTCMPIRQTRVDSISSGGIAAASIETTLATPMLASTAHSPELHWHSPGFAWDTRAWALQERLLSRRLLHLTGAQMYWECNELKASETFPRGLPSLIWEKVHTKTMATEARDSLASPRMLRNNLSVKADQGCLAEAVISPQQCRPNESVFGKEDCLCRVAFDGQERIPGAGTRDGAVNASVARRADDRVNGEYHTEDNGGVQRSRNVDVKVEEDCMDCDEIGSRYLGS
ncbi:hypothetical protein K491DRAFT_686426 [Lophiostoma macrostomum CBS 122681]|uniref:Protein kinase domain-containing protein n=1 Tax=Lophiostoma macrostomum CBS 122681 TaxID=1314788 RepID=A0A6A6TTP5_9PLEO|nr:hypothetical protein K491DRAFT_686426 [Lophiostoma macrostomum CBS 122681]